MSIASIEKIKTASWKPLTANSAKFSRNARPNLGAYRRRQGETLSGHIESRLHHGTCGSDFAAADEPFPGAAV
jgi:hypothetical protein